MKNPAYYGFLYLILMFFSAITIFSCTEKQKKNTSEDPQAVKVIGRAIEKSGGLNKWEQVEKLSFKKKTRTYDSLGRVIINKEEVIDFGMGEKNYGIISWMEKDDLYRIEKQSGSVVLYKNNQPLMSESWSLVEKVNSALYTVGMPYKLMDQGNQLSMIDVSDSLFQQEAFKIEVKTEGSQDTWWYFFGKEDQAFLGSMVHHSPSYALIVNESFSEHEGLRFIEKRKSYRVDKEGRKKHLVADYHYYDYKIVMRQP